MNRSFEGKSQSASILRLMSDLKSINQDSPEGISAAPISDENLLTWNATILGPDESPWEGGIYTLSLHFSEQEYPSKPPKIRFLSEMFHPNVYSDGSICLDIIQDHWSPIMTVGMVLTSIQSLLTDPNPDSPANPEAARLYRENMKEYKKRVRKVAEKSLESSF